VPRFNRSPNPSAGVDLTGWRGSGTRTRLTGLSGTPRTTGVSVPLTVASFGASLGCPPAVAASGQSWTGVGWVRSSVARTVRVGLVTWQSGAFVAGGGVGSTDVALSAGTWTQIRVTGTLGTAAFNEANLHVDLPTSNAFGGTLSVSSVRIEQVTDAALVYADGDSGSGWTWDGTAGSSSSTLPDTAPVTVTDDIPAGILFGDPGGESVEALTNAVTISDPLSAQIPVSDPGQASVAVEVPSGTATIQVGEPARHAVSVVTADHPAAQVQVADPGGESVTVAEPGLPAGGAPHIALWLVDRTTGGLLPLPHALKINLSPQRNSPGAFSFDYPAAGMRFETLRSEILVQRRRVLVEMWVGGSRFNALRGYVLQASLDDVEDEQTATAAFSGHFLEWRMSDAVVAHVPADPEGEARFVTATPGTIVRTLMLQAQARGTLTDISYTSFTNSLDSNSQAWAQVVSVRFTPYKTSYLAVLDRLVDLGLCEWDVVPGESGGPAKLRLFNHGTGGRDLTTRTPPVRLRRAVSLMESQRRVDLRDSGTDLYGTGSQGRYSSAVDATARARVGAQIERDLDSGSLDTQGALTAYVQASLPLVTEPVVELTHGLVFGSSNPAPVSGFRVHDWLYSDVGRGLERVRVVQWVLSQDVSGVTGSVTLNDTIGDRISRLQRRLDALTDGSATVGTSRPPAGDDSLTPSAPTGVSADSTAYQEGGDTVAVLYVGWTRVTTNGSGPATPKAEAADLIRQRLAAGGFVEEDFTWVGDPSVVDRWGEVLAPEYYTATGGDAALLNGSQSGQAQSWLAAYVAANQATGTAADDIAGYRVEYSYASAPTIWNVGKNVSGGSTETASFGTLTAGVTVRVRVFCYDTTGNTSPPSAVVELVTETDNVAPPTPSTPVVTTRVSILAATWDGLGSAGEAMPVDLDFVEVHVSAASSFTPSTATYYDRLPPGGGVMPITGRTYGAAAFVRLVAVDKTTPAANRSGPSGQGSATPAPVESADIFDGAVGTLKLADLVVTTAKINDLAVNAAKIGTVNAGSIITGTMSALLTLSGLIRTDVSPNRRMEIDGNGWHSYTAANILWADLNVATETMLVTGTIQTGTAGKRVRILPDGTQLFYPTSGTNFGRIENTGGDLRMRGQLSGASLAGWITIDATRSALTFGTSDATPRTRFQVDPVAAAAWAPIVSMRVDRTQGNPDAFGPRMLWTHFSSGGDISNSVVHYGIVPSSGFPHLYGAVTNIGFVFDGGSGGYVAVVDNTDFTRRPIQASEFQVFSDPRLKRRVADINFTGGARAVVRGAPSKKFQLVSDLRTRPSRPGVQVLRTGLDAQGRPTREMVDAEWSDPPAQPQWHFGPMADDLPEEMQRPGSDGVLAVSIDGKIGVLWKATEELDVQLTALASQVADLIDRRTP